MAGFDEKVKVSKEEFVAKADQNGWLFYDHKGVSLTDGAVMGLLYDEAQKSDDERLHNLVANILKKDVNQKEIRSEYEKEIKETLTVVIQDEKTSEESKENLKKVVDNLTPKYSNLIEPNKMGRELRNLKRQMISNGWKKEDEPIIDKMVNFISLNSVYLMGNFMGFAVPESANLLRKTRIDSGNYVRERDTLIHSFLLNANEEVPNRGGDAFKRLKNGLLPVIKPTLDQMEEEENQRRIEEEKRLAEQRLEEQRKLQEENAKKEKTENAKKENEQKESEIKNPKKENEQKESEIKNAEKENEQKESEIKNPEKENDGKGSEIEDLDGEVIPEIDLKNVNILEEMYLIPEENSEIMDMGKDSEIKDTGKKSENPDKKPSEYEQYYLDHTGENKAETRKDMVEDLSGCMAAFVLEKMGRPYKKSEIEMIGKQFKEVYYLRGMKLDDIRNALQDSESVRIAADQRREAMYGMNVEQYRKLVGEMKIMKAVMEGKKGRSAKYGAMYDAMDKIASGATLNEKDPAKRKEMITNDVITLYESTLKYMDGKEKIRWSDKGNLAYDQSLDLLACICQCGRSDILLKRTQSKIGDINLIRTGGIVKDGYISPVDFYIAHGTRHAANKRAIYNFEHNISNPPEHDFSNGGPKM